MQQRSRSIPHITIDDVTNSDILEKYIYSNLDINYYWSDDFSTQMYIALAKAGFISVTHLHEDQLLLLPEMQTLYAVLDFKDLRISKSANKLLKSNRFHLTFNTRISDVIKSIEASYEDCWIRGEYKELMLTLYKNTFDDFSLFSTELIETQTGRLVAGEIGYITHNVYTSLSGFHDPDKSYSSCGTLQLQLLARHLEEQGVRFWNLGHPHMEYKIHLGAKVVKRNDFILRWLEK